jgi:hypothetical protein
LRQIDGAKQQWALENNKAATAAPSWDEIRPYLGRGPLSTVPRCPEGGSYTLGRVDEPPRCSIMPHNFNFGSVLVVDQSGLPLAHALVTVRGSNADICSTFTSTTGEAYLLNDLDVFRSARWTNSWSDGTKQIVAVKIGYSTEWVALPTIHWPVKIILKKDTQ